MQGFRSRRSVCEFGRFFGIFSIHYRDNMPIKSMKLHSIVLLALLPAACAMAATAQPTCIRGFAYESKDTAQDAFNLKVHAKSPDACWKACASNLMCHVSMFEGAGESRCVTCVLESHASRKVFGVCRHVGGATQNQPSCRGSCC